MLADLHGWRDVLGDVDLQPGGRAIGQLVGNPAAPWPASRRAGRASDNRIADGVDRAGPAEVGAHVDALGQKPRDCPERVEVDRRRWWRWLDRLRAGRQLRLGRRLDGLDRLVRRRLGFRPWPRVRGRCRGQRMQLHASLHEGCCQLPSGSSRAAAAAAPVPAVPPSADSRPGAAGCASQANPMATAAAPTTTAVLAIATTGAGLSLAAGGLLCLGCGSRRPPARLADGFLWRADVLDTASL